MSREPGWYWIRSKRPGALDSEVAYFDGTEWHSISYATPANDDEVEVLSGRLEPPTDGTPQGGSP